MVRRNVEDKVGHIVWFGLKPSKTLTNQWSREATTPRAPHTIHEFSFDDAPRIRNYQQKRFVSPPFEFESIVNCISL